MLPTRYQRVTTYLYIDLELCNALPHVTIFKIILNGYTYLKKN